MAATPIQILVENDVKGTGKICNILKHIPKGVSATVDLWYCVDLSIYDKKSKWVQTTNTDAVSIQAAAILTAMAPAV